MIANSVRCMMHDLGGFLVSLLMTAVLIGCQSVADDTATAPTMQERQSASAAQRDAAPAANPQPVADPAAPSREPQAPVTSASPAAPPVLPFDRALLNAATALLNGAQLAGPGAKHPLVIDPL